LPNVNPSNPGKMVDFISNPALLSTYADQFAPYDVDWKTPFSGTLFRLPLRTDALAVESKLSKRVLSAEAAQQILGSLIEEANAMLLFLKNVAQIEIRMWNVGASSIHQVYCCSIANMTQQLLSLRHVSARLPVDAAAASNTALTRTVGTPPTVADYSLEIRCQHAGKPAYVEVWDVCNQHGGNRADKIAQDPNNSLLKLVPWGGVAACISSNKSTLWGPGCGIDSSVSITGLAYCFLPLPIRTELPVMVR
jgi:sacsin